MIQKPIQHLAPSQDWRGDSLDAGRKHYEAQGFQWFDGYDDEGWMLLRKDALEAYVRRDKKALVWLGTVSRLRLRQNDEQQRSLR